MTTFFRWLFATLSRRPLIGTTTTGRIDTTRPNITSTPKETLVTMNTNKLMLRPRRSRGNTQIQIPVALYNSVFFSGVDGLTSQTGEFHKLVFAHARGRLNTIKVEVPEIGRMVDPVLVLTHNGLGSVTYEAIDGLTTRGQDITRLLVYGFGVSRSVTRRANPTLWKQTSQAA